MCIYMNLYVYTSIYTYFIYMNVCMDASIYRSSPSNFIVDLP